MRPQASARRHFGKSAAHLTADEAGRLAGILPDPRRRSVKGAAAIDRAPFVRSHPAPFPGDPFFDKIRRDYRARRLGPWTCLR